MSANYSSVNNRSEANSIKSRYKARKEQFASESKALSNKMNLISNLRLLTVVLGIGLTGYLFYIGNYVVSFFSLIIFTTIFIFLVIRYRVLTNKRNYAWALADINERSLIRLKGSWNSFEDTGNEFLDHDHPYAEDLDIFGQNSLFQWINTTTTFSGRHKLKTMLTQPCNKIEEIQARQRSIQELAEKLHWRQHLEALGKQPEYEHRNNKELQVDPLNLISWAKTQNPFYLKTWLKVIVNLLPLITLSFIIAAIMTGVTYIFPIIMIALHILILTYDYSNRISEFSLISGFNEKLSAYKDILTAIETEQFHGSMLTKLQDTILNSKTGTNASDRLKLLDEIMEFISHRSGQFYIIFNILFLLDYRWQISLEHWKHQSGDELEQWFDILGDFEALSSLAIIPCDHPDWAQPEITAEPGLFQAEQIGHPLLTEHRVCNDIDMGSSTNSLLITGSNMSGKSTLLRTAGINLVLAYLGAPVCANTMQASLMKIYTCMRVSDNLEKNLSSFYAELLRIKHIVKSAEQIPVFYLLDEIFKGTNSRDRHTGARAVIKKLQSEGALGLVSTHDLELGALESQNTSIKNYHFREYYQNGEIYFDYILRPGLAPTTNAIYLMKMAGIDPDEEDLG
ncbi:MutS family DNA mismatch repair protein [Natranaerobius thermophilus]|uniref:DNA mismatch repair protein MutS domain protein n=1 Tax=Natranaerobius thermophilus (strain ATCC BAA-1301 / DSM 18059 / JW/NM-WN-LF) TaxID=457570 RepID=B2A7J8_NATTJ|nr:MutS family DNA mismatch repair protein [Natranaerobius thermophilus]ACB85707.1 DNA mismatch repair protein MutS domain protein [Natranaerobius thermophilus JW/NM-WN-LF]